MRFGAPVERGSGPGPDQLNLQAQLGLLVGHEDGVGAGARRRDVKMKAYGSETASPGIAKTATWNLFAQEGSDRIQPICSTRRSIPREPCP